MFFLFSLESAAYKKDRINVNPLLEKVFENSKDKNLPKILWNGLRQQFYSVVDIVFVSSQSTKSFNCFYKIIRDDAYF
jgi:hypothetical protein